MKPLVFMSGQLTTVATLAVTENWGFTTVSRKAFDEGESFSLENLSNKWRGGIYYASDPDADIVKNNLEVLSNFPCWPDPKKLIRMIDRHEVAKECFRNGFYGSDPCEVSTWEKYVEKSPTAIVDTVVKTGNEHSGTGKFLYRAGIDFIEWEGLATIQPFFVGRSIRILHIDSAMFFIETINESSWIKNAPGGENIKCNAKDVPEGMMDHSFKVRDHFGLDVCGNDYIVCDDGSFHFLEVNQFPGLGDDFLGDIPRLFFLERMRSLEKIVGDGESILRSAMHTTR